VSAGGGEEAPRREIAPICLLPFYQCVLEDTLGLHPGFIKGTLHQESRAQALEVYQHTIIQPFKNAFLSRNLDRNMPKLGIFGIML